MNSTAQVIDDLLVVLLLAGGAGLFTLVYLDTDNVLVVRHASGGLYRLVVVPALGL